MLLQHSLRETFSDSHEAAAELSETLEEHVDGPTHVVPLGAGSRALAVAVADRLSCPVSEQVPSEVPHTVVIVAERLRRIGPVDALIDALLDAGAERIVIATPLAESSTAYAVDDRADAFVCLRRAPKLGTIGEWYDHWTFAAARPPRVLAPISGIAIRAHAL